MKDEILKVQNLNYGIGYKKILKNISFSIYKNECILLTGENGAGKSTLLKCILDHSKFENSIELTHSKEQFYFLSYLGHDAGLYSSLSLKENIEYFYGILKHRIEKSKIEDLLIRFKLNKRLEDPIFTFSKGMKQKSGLLRALLSKSALYLLDEPFSGLDSNSTDELIKILEELKKEHSMLIVSHDLHVLSKLPDRRFNIQGGELKIDTFHD